MKKNFLIWILTFAAIMPMLLSCGGKDDLIGTFEMDQNDVTKVLKNKDAKINLSIKFSFDKNDDMKMFLSFYVFDYNNSKDLVSRRKSRIENWRKRASVNNSDGSQDQFSIKSRPFHCEVIYTGKWDYSSQNKQIILDLGDYEVKRGSDMNEEMMKIFKELIFGEEEMEDLKQSLKGKALNIKDLDESGFTVENRPDGTIRFNRVK